MLRGRTHRFLRFAAGTLCLAAGYALLISWLDPGLAWPMTLEREPWFLAALNVIPALMVTGIFMIMTRRPVLASWLTVLLLAALYAINTAKLAELATPLLPDDFHFLRELRLSYTLLGAYLVVTRLTLLIGVGVLATTLMLAWEPVVRHLTWKRRAAIGLAVVVAAVTLLIGAGPWGRLYDPGRLQFEPWAPADSALRTGLITNLLLLNWELRQPGLAVPDLAAASLLIRDFNAALIDSSGRRPAISPLPEHLPDIVILQSESLFDPARLVGVKGPHLPNLRQLAERGWSGDLAVPTFGGSTIRTEFEVLTGLPLEAFPELRYPYLQLPRREMPSLVRTLRQHGYRTVAIHPNGGAFWNRSQAFRTLGFEHFIDGADFADSPIEGRYVSDAALTDRVIAELRDEGAPQLIMAISIQNHAPYTQVEPKSPATGPPDGMPAGLDDTARESWQTYTSLLEKTDEQLERLASHLMKRERPTLLLFYGDHLPPLHVVYERLPFRDGRAPQQQPVPWLLLDNRSAERRSEDTASWMLPALLMTRAGIRQRDYFDLLESVRQRWSEEGLRADEMRDSIAAIAQLQFRDELHATMQAPDQDCRGADEPAECTGPANAP